jgi:CheY-like chemotaxis protein
VKKQLLLIFIIIILMPIIVMTVMAFRTYGNSENQILEEQRDTANNILISNNRILQNKFRMIENDLNQLVFDSSLTAREIRSETTRVKLVNEVFIINSDNKFIFPPEDGEMSQRERDFISEAKNIELINSLRSMISPTESRAEHSRWYTWFMGDGINFVYFTTSGSEIKGILLERYALLSELINVLPQSEENDSSFKVHLSDARGNLLYQWGSYIPEESSEPIREFSLSEPLNSWRLFYYIDENSEEKSIIKNRNLLLFSGLVFMTIVIVLLSFYFYRENTREMAVARQQVTFVNQVSHELKTPLTNIRLYSELLQEKLIDKKQREFLDIIINEGSRLGRMINNVLTFSKGEQGELTKKNEETNISLLITEVLDKFKLQFTKNGMEISYEKTNLPMIQTDRDMIEQILINLVGNAVKYGVSGKFLAIKTEVFSAEDGLSAFDLYERKNPDLLCLDIMMPGINGYDLCKKIRKKGDRTPVIFVSAKSEENDPSNPIEIETVPTAGYRHL